MSRHEVLRQSENTEYKYTLAFVGYGDESATACSNSPITRASTSTISARLTATSRSKSTTPPARCDRIREARRQGDARSGPVKGGTTVIAFVEDPDGYKVELIERHS